MRTSTYCRGTAKSDRVRQSDNLPLPWTGVARMCGVLAALMCLALVGAGCSSSDGSDGSAGAGGGGGATDDGGGQSNAGPVMVLSTTALDAGAFACGFQNGSNATIALPSFDVSNTGNATLDVTVTPSTGNIVNYDLPWQFSVQPGAVKTLTPGYMSGACCTDQEAIHETITLGTNDPAQPEAVISLTGTGLIDVFQISPTSLAWSTSNMSDKPFTITNTGQVAFRVADLYADSNDISPFDFISYPGDGTASDTIQPGASATFHIFLPSSTQLTDTIKRTLTLETNVLDYCPPKTTVLTLTATP
jgi:hypothetical protein